VIVREGSRLLRRQTFQDSPVLVEALLQELSEGLIC
jgi:hypothetical protein